MKFSAILASCLLSTVFCMQSDARAADRLSLEALVGKYEGKLQIHNNKQTEYSYQIEITAEDVKTNAVSLAAYCGNCENKVRNRKNCVVQEQGEKIKFFCKSSVFEEEYVFDGERLKASGLGRSPYSVNVTKQ